MTSEDFTATCKDAAVVWFNTQEYKDPYGCTHFIAHEDVNIVWSVKCLRNYKAIMSVLCESWGPPNILFEFSYSGDKKELYMDVYSKAYNRSFNIVG